ncbi:uncharacterized protein LOC119265425 [Pygocentrus nattereri]|uniref:uncharacterized protein LOC119265425 n=1 Tax=Pygocentrus nattereri TaxID=42514 RepID=UPI001891C305|nr:uncharacterized protein LOC119265425 [Pygocentrus nattereri]
MKCGVCKLHMRLEKCRTADGLRWTCTKFHKKVKKSVRQNSIFYKSHSSLKKWMQFIYRFSQGLRLRQLDMISDGIAGSSVTLTRMAQIMREVCITAHTRMKQRGMKMGGPGTFVVIDESKFAHKRKYNRGRCGNTWRRNRQWVFGMLEVSPTNSRPILKLVRTRSRAVLMHHIRAHVRRRTAIISDEWRAYAGQLDRAGYRHYTVCHKNVFVDPDTGAHTQHIERAWGTFKVEVWRHRGNRTTALLKDHLKVIEWHHWLAKSHRHYVLGRLFHDIKQMNQLL